MNIDRQVSGSITQLCLDGLSGLGLRDLVLASQRLSKIIDAGMPVDLIPQLMSRLREHLLIVADPDSAIDYFVRFVAASRSPLAVATMIERDAPFLGILLDLFGASPLAAEWLVADPESFDLVRITGGQSAPRDSLIPELCAEVDTLSEPHSAMIALRRFKRRESVRIVYGDVIEQQPVKSVMSQLSHVADAICEAALRTARRATLATRGVPRRADGGESGFVVIGLGRLGGEELGYRDKLQLVCLYESEGRTDGPKSTSNDEYFQRLAEEFRLLLVSDTSLGRAYDVSFSCRPHGQASALVSSVDRALHYYDTMGRTWERQAYVKARAVAGDDRLGHEFLSQFNPWIYRRFLNPTDVAGVRALKRGIERATRIEAGFSGSPQLKQAIRDIEQGVQFLQFINGGQDISVRTTNTLIAIENLAHAGCLTPEERETLLGSYSFLRKLNHRIDIAFDRESETALDDPVNQVQLASLMGYAAKTGDGRFRFSADYRQAVRTSQSAIQSLLLDSFGGDAEWIPESDLILDPQPADEVIAKTLRPFGFQDICLAYQHLISLASERIRFLSTRRCRYFLSLIARELLRLIGQTPTPDATLECLAHVSDSLGGKGGLWELFSVSPPTLDLYVRLCAGSPYLTSILTENPGMLDDLMDSLVLNKLASRDTLRTMLNELARGADDLDAILHNFKGVRHLEAGVRDILGKEDIQRSMSFLADVAQVCIERITGIQYEQLSGKFGTPQLGNGNGACGFSVVALGKLGGCEPNYHSNFDLILLYDGDGSTLPAGRHPPRATSNQHFFNELAQRIVQQCHRAGTRGRLFEVEFDTRTTGSRAAAVSLDEFARFYRKDRASVHEWQSLCRARSIFGTEDMPRRVDDLNRQLLQTYSLEAVDRAEIRKARMGLEQTAKTWNLKRSPGGTMDVEYVAQTLQLQHAGTNPNVLAASTLESLSKLRDAECLPKEQAISLIESYRYLRRVEARLRLMNSAARHELPLEPIQSGKLIYLLGIESDERLRNECRDHMNRNRQIFDEIIPS